MTPEFLSFVSLILCSVAILVSVRFFGKSGLFVYTGTVVIASNLQVLKLTQYSFVDNPIALGTVAFATVFAVDNILTEYYGSEAAKKNIWLSFMCYLLFAVLMKLAVLHPAVSHDKCTNLHGEFNRIFSPGLILLGASLISYAVGQLSDIFIFSTLKKMLKDRYVSIRSFCSMAISTFLDNCIFSVFAWMVFAENPVSWKELWYTYIFIAYLMRLLVAVLCVPLVRLAGYLVNKR